MDNQIVAMESLRDHLIKQGKHKDALEVNKYILKRKQEIGLEARPCPVIYVDFKNKCVIRIAA